MLDWWDVLSKCALPPSHVAPSSLHSGQPPFGQLAEHVFCGSIQGVTDAQYVGRVREAKIRVIINCTSSSFDCPEGVDRCVSIPAPNAEAFIRENLQFVTDVLEECRLEKKRGILVCASGVNKAAALAAAYLMQWRGAGLLSTIALMVRRIGPVLTVNRFRRETLNWATANKHLETSQDLGIFLAAPPAAPLEEAWGLAPEVFFEDDADYDANKHVPDLDLAQSPQDRAFQVYAKQKNQHERGNLIELNALPDASDFASDGDDLL